MLEAAGVKHSAVEREKRRRRKLRREAIALLTLIALPLVIGATLRIFGLNVEWSVKPGSPLDALMKHSPELAVVWSTFVATFTGNIGHVYAFALLLAIGVVLIYFVARLAIVLGADLLDRATTPLRNFIDAVKGKAGAVAGAAAGAAGVVVGGIGQAAANARDAVVGGGAAIGNNVMAALGRGTKQQKEDVSGNAGLLSPPSDAVSS